MRRILVATVCGVVLAASAASAQVTGIVTNQSVNYSEVIPIPGGSTMAISNGPVPSENQQYSANFDSYPSVDNYQVSTTIDNTQGYIAFANNATSAGAYGDVSATTSIAVSYTNPTLSTINPTLNSTIIPGGFGVYVGNLNKNPTLQNYGNSPYAGQAPEVTDINKTPEATNATLLSFPTIIGGSTPEPALAPSASISFQILSGSTVVASYTASLVIYMNASVSTVPVGQIDAVLTTNFSSPLNDFGLIRADDPTKAVGYSWDATNISVPLGEIAPGASSTLTYVTTVTTSQYEGDETYGDAVVAYSGFGDPIGKNVGAKGISDPNFPQLELGLPSFQVDPLTGAATLTAATFNGTYTPALPLTSVDLTPPEPVPEPAAWALMLAGLGMIGSALRRRPSVDRSVAEPQYLT